jgi:hypothetical protein
LASFRQERLADDSPPVAGFARLVDPRIATNTGGADIPCSAGLVDPGITMNVAGRTGLVDPWIAANAGSADVTCCPGLIDPGIAMDIARHPRLVDSGIPRSRDA